MEFMYLALSASDLANKILPILCACMAVHTANLKFSFRVFLVSVGYKWEQQNLHKYGVA